MPPDEPPHELPELELDLGQVTNAPSGTPANTAASQHGGGLRFDEDDAGGLPADVVIAAPAVLPTAEPRRDHTPREPVHFEPPRLAEVRKAAAFGPARDDLLGAMLYALRVNSRRRALSAELARAEQSAEQLGLLEDERRVRARRVELLRQAISSADPLAESRGRVTLIIAAVLAVSVVVAVVATAIRTTLAGRP